MLAVFRVHIKLGDVIKHVVENHLVRGVVLDFVHVTRLSSA
jgi:hypothetical protein